MYDVKWKDTADRGGTSKQPMLTTGAFHNGKPSLGAEKLTGFKEWLGPHNGPLHGLHREQLFTR